MTPAQERAVRAVWDFRRAQAEALRVQNDRIDRGVPSSVVSATYTALEQARARMYQCGYTLTEDEAQEVLRALPADNQPS